MDDKSLEAVGKWPWPRRYHADVVDKLVQMGAKQIFFDVDFSSASTSADDRAFAAALSRAGIVTLASRFVLDPSTGKRTDHLPLPSFRKAVSLANINVRYNFQGAVLDLPYAFEQGGVTYPSMAAALAGKSGPPNKSFEIDYSLDPATFPVVSAADVIGGSADPTMLSGKTVLVGTASFQLGDIYFAPGIGQLPGAFLHALGAETLKAGTPSYLSWVVPFAFACAMMLLACRTSSFRRVVGLLSLGIAPVVMAPFALDAYLISTGIMPSLFLLIGGGGTLAWSRYKKHLKSRATVNAATGLPNFNALKGSDDVRAEFLVAAKVHNYDEVAATLRPGEEKQLVEQICARLSVGRDAGDLFQGDGGSFVWFEPQSVDFDDHLDALHSLFRSPVSLAGRKVDLAVTFGIDSTIDRSILTRMASAFFAADEAKDSGVKWRKHDAGSIAASEWKLSLLSQLEEGLKSGDVWVAYQPKLELSSGLTIGAEALIRWTHPERGPISPQDFILEAEQRNRIDTLTSFVLDRAVEAAATINRKRRFGIAVNISARLINDPILTEMVRLCLEKHGLDPRCLTLEVTETASITAGSADLGPLHDLSNMGVRISIDDYGTGLSTLEYLKKVPAVELKIDRGFVQALTRSQSDRLMVHSTLQLAHSLRRTVVAEGVENRETLDALRGMGCDIAQGFFIARPMTFENLTDYLSKSDEVVSDSRKVFAG
jgi:EAL domain-containing protein (putative c-di-GMP-specific phosphodiesterase class I)/CHASE2 domain-containing sensor protein